MQEITLVDLVKGFRPTAEQEPALKRICKELGIWTIDDAIERQCPVCKSIDWQHNYCHLEFED